MKLRSLTANEVEFELDTEPELEPFESNAQASGDDEADRKVEEGIRERLQYGDVSAWCILVVRAKWKGYEGVATLGGYSFPAGQTGDQNREYAAENFECLKAEALADLNRTLHERATIPEEIRALAL